MILKYYAVNSKFKHAFTISKGTKTHQPALIVSLEHKGFIGYGEAPAIAYYQIPVEKMISDIESKKQFIDAAHGSSGWPLACGNSCASFLRSPRLKAWLISSSRLSPAALTPGRAL